MAFMKLHCHMYACQLHRQICRLPEMNITVMCIKCKQCFSFGMPMYRYRYRSLTLRISAFVNGCKEVAAVVAYVILSVNRYFTDLQPADLFHLGQSWASSWQLKISKFEFRRQ